MHSCYYCSRINWRRRQRRSGRWARLWRTNDRMCIISCIGMGGGRPAGREWNIFPAGDHGLRFAWGFCAALVQPLVALIAFRRRVSVRSGAGRTMGEPCKNSAQQPNAWRDRLLWYSVHQSPPPHPAPRSRLPEPSKVARGAMPSRPAVGPTAENEIDRTRTHAIPTRRLVTFRFCVDFWRGNTWIIIGSSRVGNC